MRQCDRCDRHALVGAGFAGFVFGLIAACVVAMSAGGCAAPPQLPGARVIPVAITAWPAAIKPRCEVPDLGEVPDIFLWQKLTDEEAGRIYITQRQLADLIVWLHDLKLVADQQAKCFAKLTETP